MRARRVTVLSVLGGLLVGLVSALPASAATTASVPALLSTPTAPVAALLSALTMAPENTSTYSRDYFQHWIDANGNGCDTRAEVLIAESLAATGGGCPVNTGRWISSYDDAVWTNASDVDIDHMVALSEAWDSGAQSWTAAQRRDFANDLAWGPSLVAVTDNVNSSKGDRDPAQWMPPLASAACQYVSDWVTVKYRWHLDVDPAERDALTGYLSSTCPGLTAPIPTRANVPDSIATIQAYVTKVYSDLFGRNPDPTGLAGWTSALQSGTPYGAVANSITASREFRAGLINQSYRDYLDRGADPTGLESWLTAMNQGLQIEQMQAGFIASPEFYARSGGTDAGWITALYQKVLGRGPAASEVGSWVTALAQGGSRTQVAIGFLYSTEHLTTVVNGYYLHLLDRGIDPAGGRSWVSAIQGGARDEQIIAGLVASDEYRSKP